jgi:DnaJ-class molecular chaperone
MNKKIFDPEKYGMRTCPSCDSRGFIQNPNHQCCPKCGGFGFMTKETDKDISIDGVSKISLGPNLSDDDRSP